MYALKILNILILKYNKNVHNSEILIEQSIEFVRKTFVEIMQQKFIIELIKFALYNSTMGIGHPIYFVVLSLQSTSTFVYSVSGE